MRDWLLSHRVRPHVISGIEFQMAIFIVAPLTGLIIAIPIGVGAIFVLFEVAVLYKFWLSTQDYRRALAELTAPGALPSPRAGASAGPAR